MLLGPIECGSSGSDFVEDNLDAQKQPEYIKFLSNWGVEDHKLPPNETDQVQPIDRGLGRQIKVYVGQQVSCARCPAPPAHTHTYTQQAADHHTHLCYCCVADG
jgi:hypothetical protein